MKSLSFGKKLLLSLISVTLISLGIMIFLVSSYSYTNSESDAKAYIRELASKNAHEINNTLEKAITVTTSLSSKYTSALEHNEKISKDGTISYFKSVLTHNPFILGIWFAFEDNSKFYEVGIDEKNPNYYTKSGAFQPYVTRGSNNDFVIQPGSEFDITSEWIALPYEQKTITITKPYKYPVNGKDVLMATISAPVFKDGKFLGAVGVDFSLDSFNKKVNEIKLFETGYGILVDSYGSVITHPIDKNLGKNLKDISTNKDVLAVLEKTSKGENYDFYAQNLKTGKDSFFHSSAFEFGNSGKYWSFIVSAPEEEFLVNAKFIKNFSIISGIVVLLVLILVVLVSIRVLNRNLDLIKNGLDDFFKYLNKQTNQTTSIKINSLDEFGQMALQINKNVEAIQENINKENLLIENVKNVVNEVNKGFFIKRIENSSNTASLNELKVLINQMLDTLQNFVGKDINKLQAVLLEYSKANFINKLDENSGTIGKEISSLNEMITEMLKDNKLGGLKLENSSKELSQNVETISKNATSQAASLEETAASIEEITSNIKNTNEKAQEMLRISSDTKNSALKGKELATKTVSSMDEINEQVNAINEAITVIDQIAFQTNILSLNAAVEAATA
ncbi:methyl-accepting chemotaxis protein, partial [Malaciobacter mytili]